MNRKEKPFGTSTKENVIPQPLLGSGLAERKAMLGTEAHGHEHKEKDKKNAITINSILATSSTVHQYLRGQNKPVTFSRITFDDGTNLRVRYIRNGVCQPNGLGTVPHDHEHKEDEKENQITINSGMLGTGAHGHEHKEDDKENQITINSGMLGTVANDHEDKEDDKENEITINSGMLGTVSHDHEHKHKEDGKENKITINSFLVGTVHHGHEHNEDDQESDGTVGHEHNEDNKENEITINSILATSPTVPQYLRGQNKPVTFSRITFDVGSTLGVQYIQNGVCQPNHPDPHYNPLLTHQLKLNETNLSTPLEIADPVPVHGNPTRTQRKEIKSMGKNLELVRFGDIDKSVEQRIAESIMQGLSKPLPKMEQWPKRIRKRRRDTATAPAPTQNQAVDPDHGIAEDDFAACYGHDFAPSGTSSDTISDRDKHWPTWCGEYLKDIDFHKPDDEDMVSFMELGTLDENLDIDDPDFQPSFENPFGFLDMTLPQFQDYVPI